MKNIQIELWDGDDLSEIIAKAVRSEIEKVISLKTSEEEYLTRDQVKDLLQISLPTLDKWTKEGSVPSFRIANQIRYKKSMINGIADEIPHMKYRR